MPKVGSRPLYNLYEMGFRDGSRVTFPPAPSEVAFVAGKLVFRYGAEKYVRLNELRDAIFEKNSLGKSMRKSAKIRPGYMSIDGRDFQEAYTATYGPKGVAARDADRELVSEIDRIASAIEGRVAQSGEFQVRQRPIRTSLEGTALRALLDNKWSEQGGRCGLCDQPIRLWGIPLLRSSVDRIDSGVASYDFDNIHITHLACNLAKNDSSMTEFCDWLTVVRGREVG